MEVDTVVRDSSVGIATHYGLDGPGIESQWRRDFYRPSRMALSLTQPPIQWVPAYSRGGVKRPGRDIDHPPHLAPRLNSRAITLGPHLGLQACSSVNLPFTFLIRQLCRIAKSNC